MINIKLYKSFNLPGQHTNEWFHFLLFVQNYFASLENFNAVVVEIGSKAQHQRAYYERFVVGANYISIDRDTRYAVPTILGESQDETTLTKLKDHLKEFGFDHIDLLFIDGDHRYARVKADYEMYSPLVKHITVLHDLGIEGGPGRLFQEIQQNDPKNKTFMTFRNYTATQKLPGPEPIPMGIGLIIQNQDLIGD